MSTITRYCAVLGMIAAMHMTEAAVPKYIGCVDQSECGFGTCCALGQFKYSIPQCLARGELGQPCRLLNNDDEETYNTTLYYPDGEAVEVTNVYHVLCPCAQGLYCSTESATCRDPIEDTKFNEVDLDLTY